jgi:hypothetical protein
MLWYVIALYAYPSSFIHPLHQKRINEVGEDAELYTLKRAVRSVPGSGEVWARYLRYLVSHDIQKLLVPFPQLHLLDRNGLSTLRKLQRIEKLFQVSLPNHFSSQ